MTAVGLAEIQPGVTGLQSLPMMFRDFDEVEYVNDKLRPMLEKRLADKGFVVLFWVDAGWVRYFSKEPMVTPDEMRKMKVFVWAGNPAQIDIMKKHGYNPVGLETGDILPGLQTGLVNVVPAPPVFALYSQVDKRAPHMIDLKWAPLVGACVIKKDIWDKIPPEAKEYMLKAASEAGREIRANSRKESVESVAAMLGGVVSLTVTVWVQVALPARWLSSSPVCALYGPATSCEYLILRHRVKDYRAGGGRK